ncbi:hypothetical protein HMPREF1052_1474 [Pasteurella bettyae CCUG 2042]|uniref:Uncharacterized protein n=1 Tax=Pasteurella bettyae CCUG 2042 TaxID=1095749 RepID=I3DFC2_9PAST|nr:hypothetical protein HMPREF1052_1474 [Pasteurella bettyae CCUG 2042]
MIRHLMSHKTESGKNLQKICKFWNADHKNSAKTDRTLW